MTRLIWILTTATVAVSLVSVAISVAAIGNVMGWWRIP